MSEYELIASKGCGSAVIEMALELAGLPHRVTLIPYLEPGPGRERLLSLNPLGQVPTLVLPGGTVMTESAAMALHIHDAAPQAGLAPRPDDPSRAAFLNLLVVLVGALYPTFTLGPSRNRSASTRRPPPSFGHRPMPGACGSGSMWNLWFHRIRMCSAGP